MNINVGLFQQQTLKLSMTQELSQAIALLQYSTHELSNFLENKAIDNPLIQLDSNQMMEFGRNRKKTKKMNIDSKNNWIEQISEKVGSLDPYLLSQLSPNIEGYNKKIFLHLIENIDESGYLRIEIESVANIFRVSSNEVERHINLLQSLEPAGIGARSLQECLLLQLNRFQEPNQLAITIIDEYFIPFAEKKWKDIAKNLQVSLKDIQDVFDYIQALNPRPGARFSVEKAAYVVPDVMVEWDGNEIKLHFNDQMLPKVSLNETYINNLNAHQDPAVKTFLQEKMQDFQWVVRSLEQRRQTLTKVVIKIVEKQPEFFRYGSKSIKPMTMKEIADELGIHESTVSRTVREKYIQTPFGTFDMRSFFTSTIQTASEESTSSAQVKQIIRQLIEKENKQKPLSDQDIVSLLNDQEGIVVSRRTVAKYRDQLGILSSSKRKRYD